MIIAYDLLVSLSSQTTMPFVKRVLTVLQRPAPKSPASIAYAMSIKMQPIGLQLSGDVIVIHYVMVVLDLLITTVLVAQVEMTILYNWMHLMCVCYIVVLINRLMGVDA